MKVLPSNISLEGQMGRKQILKEFIQALNALWVTDKSLCCEINKNKKNYKGKDNVIDETSGQFRIQIILVFGSHHCCWINCRNVPIEVAIEEPQHIQPVDQRKKVSAVNEQRHQNDNDRWQLPFGPFDETFLEIPHIGAVVHQVIEQHSVVHQRYHGK